MKKLIILCFMLVSVLSFSFKKNPSIGLEKGDKLSIMDLYDTKGELQGTSEKYLGKITIYNFGASWCPPCKVEKPLLNKFYNENKEKLNVVSIMVDTNAKDIDKFYIDHPMDFSHFFDKNQVLSRKFLIRVVPTSYVVDEEGVILERIQGAIDWTTIKMEDLEGLKE